MRANHPTYYFREVQTQVGSFVTCIECLLFRQSFVGSRLMKQGKIPLPLGATRRQLTPPENLPELLGIPFFGFLTRAAMRAGGPPHLELRATLRISPEVVPKYTQSLTGSLTTTCNNGFKSEEVKEESTLRYLTLWHPGFWILVITWGGGPKDPQLYFAFFWAFLCHLVSMLNHI